MVAESGTQLNMRAVFLHVLGDALGSVVVIISGILIKFLDADWKYKIDPILRYFTAYDILYSFIHSFIKCLVLGLQRAGTAWQYNSHKREKLKMSTQINVKKVSL